jgi:hypothetical protein
LPRKGQTIPKAKLSISVTLTGQIPKMTSRDHERGATAVQQLMDGLFCSLSFFIFLTLRLVKRFVQRKLCEEITGSAAQWKLRINGSRQNNFISRRVSALVKAWTLHCRR